MEINDVVLSNIHPVDVKIYLEDEVPYIDYVGTVDTTVGTFKVRIPKLSLELETIEVERETCEYVDGYFNTPLAVSVRQQFFAKNNKPYTIEIIERTMTKAQIEKELGYKVKICE